MRPSVYLILSLLLLSCSGSSQTNKAKDLPVVNEMLDEFRQQEHRLEFNGCEMLYNDTPFELGMTINELIEVFGEYDMSNRMYYVWEDIGIVASKENEGPNLNEPTTYVFTYLNTTVHNEYLEALKHRLHHKNDYFLIEGMPLDKNMMVKDFINHSNFTLNDFTITNHSYDLEFKCDHSLRYYYSFISHGMWNYKGGGHLQMKSGPNTNNTSTIEYLFITTEK